MDVSMAVKRIYGARWEEEDNTESRPPSKVKNKTSPGSAAAPLLLPRVGSEEAR